MENIMISSQEIKRMVDFTEVPYSGNWLEQIRNSFDKERVNSSLRKRSIDKKIEDMLITM